VRDLDGLQITQEPQANAVFAVLPPGVADRLRERWLFYDWDERRGEVRWMCSWDTTEADVDAFAADVAAAVSGSPEPAPPRVPTPRPG
jgi:threonine aldolase